MYLKTILWDILKQRKTKDRSKETGIENICGVRKKLRELKTQNESDDNITENPFRIITTKWSKQRQ